MSPQIIEILVFAAIAAFLLLRLRSVLGARTGHEDPGDVVRRRGFGSQAPQDDPGTLIPLRPEPDEAQAQDEGTEEMPDLAAAGISETLREQLKALKEIEPEFTLDAFLAGAQQAYEAILMAYANGDKDQLRPLLSDEVFQDFERIIDDRARQGLVVDTRFVRIGNAEPERISFDAATRRAEVGVKFNAELITSVRDSEGAVTEGDPHSVRSQTDHWAFERTFGARNPNWTLVET